VLKGGRASSCRSKVTPNPAPRAYLSSTTANDSLMDEVGGGQDSARTPTPETQRRRSRAHGHLQPVGVEVVQCADCPRTFERPIVPKGRPRQFCSKSCANYASRRRVKGTTLTPAKVVKAKWQAQRRAAPPTFADALEGLRGLPELHEILTGAVVESEHGHEALRRTPTEATSAQAHPAEAQQKPTNKRTRPEQGKENQ
jgi:hypothetical protein